MTRDVLLALVLAAFAWGACGPADDAGRPPAGSTEGTPPRGAEAPRNGARPADPGGSPAEVTLPDAASVRIVFLGTSLTAGLGLLRDAERFTDVLQTLADSAGVRVEVVNAGVSGETSAGGLRRLEWVLERPLDLLVVELGANDGLRGLSVNAMKDNLREIVRRTRARHPDARVVLVGMEAPPNLGERYTSEFRRAFQEVAREEGAAFAPFLLEGVAGDAALNQDDRIHPNAEGHRRIARSLWPYLEPMVRELATAGSR